MPPKQAIAEALAGKHDQKAMEAEVLDLARCDLAPAQPLRRERAARCLDGEVGQQSAQPGAQG